MSRDLESRKHDQNHLTKPSQLCYTWKVLWIVLNGINSNVHFRVPFNVNARIAQFVVVDVAVSLESWQWWVTPQCLLDDCIQVWQFCGHLVKVLFGSRIKAIKLTSQLAVQPILNMRI